MFAIFDTFVLSSSADEFFTSQSVSLKKSELYASHTTSARLENESERSAEVRKSEVGEVFDIQMPILFLIIGRINTYVCDYEIRE